MQPNIPLRQDNHPTFLRVENGQVGEDLPLGCCRNSRLQSLLVALVTRKDFPLALPETYGPIVKKFREKMEPLSLTLPFLCFSFSYGSLLIVLLKRGKLPPSFLPATRPFLEFSLFLFIFRSLHFSIILHLSLLLFSLYSFISPNFT